VPKIEIISRGLLLESQRLLLCTNPKHGYAYLPGGHVEFNEPAAAALARELHEEARLDVQVGPLLLVTEDAFETKGKEHHELNLVFRMERRGSDPIKSREPDLEFAWIDLASVIDADLRPASIKAWLLAGAGPALEWVSGIPSNPS
jgi:ADP-ribose pyrophosphatase YjhB (NUDIX family)